jgi:K(+)-stimulated pyrophosphate-energized sodium pump
VDLVPYLAALSALAGLGLAAFFFVAVTKESPGNERMVELMNAIQEGSRAFLRREYRWVSVFRGAPSRTCPARSCRRSPGSSA